MSLATLEKVFRALNGAQVRYLLVGGFAVAAHGHARATHDVDLVLALDRRNALAAIETLLSLGYRPIAPVHARDFADPEIRASWVETKGMLVFQLRAENSHDLPIDLFAAPPFDFDSVEASALQVELCPGLVVPVVPLSALLTMKEAAGRPKDLEDVRILRDLGS